MFYLTTHSTHFIYGYMASDIWLRTILILRKETRCRHIGYSFRLTARVLLYAPSHRQDSTYHGLCYTSRGALAGTRNSIVDEISNTFFFNIKVFCCCCFLNPLRNNNYNYLCYDTQTKTHKNLKNTHHKQMQTNKKHHKNTTNKNK